VTDNLANRKQISKAILSVFAREKRTAIYKVVQIPLDKNNPDWLQIEDSDGATSALHVSQFAKKPDIGDVFSMTTIGCNVLEVKMGHKMLFDTGVRAENHLDKKGNLIQGEYEEWVGGTLHIAYYLETPPLKNYRLDYLQPTDEVKDWQVAIKIIGGGMLSKYAVFTVLEEAHA
jgi:hypothetical protein